MDITICNPVVLSSSTRLLFLIAPSLFLWDKELPVHMLITRRKHPQRITINWLLRDFLSLSTPDQRRADPLPAKRLTTFLLRWICCDHAAVFRIISVSKVVMAFTCRQMQQQDGIRLYTSSWLVGQPMLYDLYWSVFPVNTGRSTNVVLMLIQRLWRWPNIKTTLVKCPVFAGVCSKCPFK